MDGVPWKMEKFTDARGYAGSRRRLSYRIFLSESWQIARVLPGLSTIISSSLVPASLRNTYNYFEMTHILPSNILVGHFHEWSLPHLF